MFPFRISSVLRSVNTAFAANVFKALPLAPQTVSGACSSTLLPRWNSSLVVPQSNSNPLAEMNKQIGTGTEGRLFAVVQLCGKQFKITSGDIIIVEGYWPPSNGDKIRLDKVLLAGGKDFSVIGTPLVPAGLVDIQGTIIEKTLSHTRTHFRKKRRKQYMRINFFRNQQTMIRINSIEMNPEGIKDGAESKDEESFERFF
ncbi:39S ribosomal protein L21, mitochondrial [Uranotaenia lowii]|uniref:39S ribosomal protein L21, mitochondrial n=1 Tax=Uranotaenia lowii TaxID=190385 RepID=UPI0024783DE0|nr:39S ribosomal protein L21, mitochondrial [Uranotaenia lowii]